MIQKCVHKGCEKSFEDPEEECFYHSGVPIFHEGQKGWKCCKPRVLTFDEFLTIPPCTTGKHATIIESSSTEAVSTVPEPSPPPDLHLSAPDASASVHATPAPHLSLAPSTSTSTPVPSESEDDVSLPIPPNSTCRRRGCEVTSSNIQASREGEECIYHPGRALFHEGSKGWTCCKKRVLEFDEFMKIQGCETKDRHLFTRREKNRGKEEAIGQVRSPYTRHDFYQTPTTVIASFFLKRIDKSRAKVDFPSPTTMNLDLPTADNKRYSAQIPLFGQVNTSESNFRIMSSKLELVLVKADGLSWRTLRNDEQGASGIIQTGRAERA